MAGIRSWIVGLPVVGPLARAAYRALRVRLVRVEAQNARYDLETVDVMRRILAPDSVCLDVGAHEGSILRHMVALAPRARHFAFEPLPWLAEQVRRDFPGVDVRECALADAAGEAVFHVVRNAPGYSGLRNTVAAQAGAQVDTIRVRTERLDDIVPPTVRVALVKLDVEGAELLVLRGGIETLRRSRPTIVFEAVRGATACYGFGPGDLYDLLTRELGLSVTTMRRWLEGRGEAFTREAYVRAFETGEDFYFLAAPV